MGLFKKAAKSISIEGELISCLPIEVSITNGNFSQSGYRRICAAKANPSISGICISKTAKSNISLAASQSKAKRAEAEALATIPQD